MASATKSQEDIKASGGASQAIRHTIADGATGDAIYIDPKRPTAFTMIPGTSAKVQYSTSPPSMILAGTAVWNDWSLGSVTANTSSNVEGPVTGLRGVSGVGACSLEVVTA